MPVDDDFVRLDPKPRDWKPSESPPPPSARTRTLWAAASACRLLSVIAFAAIFLRLILTMPTAMDGFGFIDAMQMFTPFSPFWLVVLLCWAIPMVFAAGWMVCDRYAPPKQSTRLQFAAWAVVFIPIALWLISSLVTTAVLTLKNFFNPRLLAVGAMLLVVIGVSMFMWQGVSRLFKKGES